MDNILEIFLLTIGASFVQRATGFGFGIAAVGTGTLLGSWAFRHIPGKIFPYVVYGYICISGIIILTSA